MGHALEKVRNALKICGQLQERKPYSLVLMRVIKSILEKKRYILTELKYFQLAIRLGCVVILVGNRFFEV